LILAFWLGAFTVAANILSMYPLLSAALQGILLQVDQAKLPQHPQVCFADAQGGDPFRDLFLAHLQHIQQTAIIERIY